MLSTTPLPQEKSISRSHQGCHSNCTVRSGLRFMWDAYQHDSYRIGLFGVLLALPSRQLQSSLVIGQNPLFLCQHMVLQVKHSSPKLMFPLCKGPRQLFSSLQIPNMVELLVLWENRRWDSWATTALLRTRGPTGHNTSSAPCPWFHSDFATLHYQISTQRPLSSKSFPMCSITFWNDTNPFVEGQYSQWFSDQVKMAHFLTEDF